MMQISYWLLILMISFIWMILRIRIWLINKRIDLKREVQLLLVYICIVVVVRFTFFPFSKVDGQIQPLILDTAKMFPPRVNFLPFVYLFDYPTKREILLNVIGNTAMFIPLGIVWPTVFRALNTHKSVIAAGFGCSFCIELLQLPFFDRVSDIDDLIMNTVGYLAGYAILHCVRNCRQRSKS